jgi:CysZ protein
MIGAFSKAFAQLSDPPIRAVIWKSVAGTILLFGLLLTGLGWALANTSLFDIAWVETAVDVFGGLATVLLALILFPGVVAALVSVLLEDIAGAVEARHYPGLGPARAMSWGVLLGASARLIGLTVLLNLLALPFYLIPGLNLVVYYGLNGYLLSREYFEVVALRRVSEADARAMRRQYRGRIWLAGAATTFMLTIPVLNMIAPVIGTAAMVHLFQKVNGGQ